MLDVQNIGPQIIPLLCRGQDRYVVVSRNREEWGIHNIFFLQIKAGMIALNPNDSQDQTEHVVLELSRFYF